MKKQRKKATRPLSRMQQFTLFFFDKTRFSLLFWASLIIFGSLSYTFLFKREGFPSVAPSIGVVNGVYFVNDSEKVDREITKPLVDAIKDREDIKSINSTSGDNFYVLQIEFDANTDVVDSLNQITNKDNLVNFPSSATIENKPIRFDKFSDDGDDLLVALYPVDGIATPDELMAVGNQLTEFINKSSGVIERAKLFNPFRVGADPITGEEKREQISFDRYAEYVNNNFTQSSSITIGIKGVGGTDALHLYDSVSELIADAEKQSFMQDYKLAITADFAEGIREQIGSLQENLIGGLLVVLLVSFLLINARASLLTAVSMIAVLAVTVGLLYIFGFTLNTITLFSLILCLGLIVDDTTIMIEAIDSHRRDKKTKREIIASAVKRVAKASTAGTFTTILGFAPMLFIGGILGSFIRAIPITVIISLLTSLIVSLGLIPLMSKYALLSSKKRWFDRFDELNPVPSLERVTSSRVAHTIRIIKRKRKLGISVAVVSIILSLGFIVLSGYFFTKGKFNIFPATKDTDGLIISLQFPAGQEIEKNEKITTTVMQKSGALLGDSLKEMSLYSSGGPQAATVYVQLTPLQEREPKSPQLKELLTAGLADTEDAIIAVSQQDVGPPSGSFAVRVFSEDSNATKELVADLQEYIKSLKVERPDGSIASTKNVQIADDQSVVRDGGRRYVEISASFDADDTSTLVTLAQNAVEDEFNSEKLASYGLNDDAIGFNFGGEEDNQESFKSMLIAFPILLVAMYLLLVVQFRSLLQPLLIFSAIPFSFFGVAAGLYYTNNPLSFFVMIGFFALIGISVNNTILLTDYANQEKAKGLGSVDAIAEAIRERFRPLLTTSITSIVALIPLVLADPFWESLGVTLIFGLLSSTILVIVSFPYYYLVAEWLRSKVSRQQFLIWLLANIGSYLVFDFVSDAPLIYLFLFNIGLLVSRKVGKTKNRKKSRFSSKKTSKNKRKLR